MGTVGFRSLAIYTQDSSKGNVVKEFMEKLGVNLPVLSDEYGIIEKRYLVTGLPCNFVVDQEGILRAKYLGYSEDVKRHFEGELIKLFSSP